MSEQLGHGFVPHIPEFDGVPRAPRFRADVAALGGAAVVPFGFSVEHSTPVTDTPDLGAGEGRSMKAADETSAEYVSI